MKSKSEIILMTKLAIYDKSHGKKDRVCNDYFKGDYVYKKNMWTRFYTAIGTLILIIFIFLHRIAVYEIDIFTLDFKTEISKYAVYFLTVLIAYTIIGSFLSAREYNKSRLRFKKYLLVLSKLDGSAKKNQHSNKEDLRHGSPTYDSRNFN